MLAFFIYKFWKNFIKGLNFKYRYDTIQMFAKNKDDLVEYYRKSERFNDLNIIRNLYKEDIRKWRYKKLWI